jgi:hypothetical protein
MEYIISSNRYTPPNKTKKSSAKKHLAGGHSTEEPKPKKSLEESQEYRAEEPSTEEPKPKKSLEESQEYRDEELQYNELSYEEHRPDELPDEESQTEELQYDEFPDEEPQTEEPQTEKPSDYKLSDEESEEYYAFRRILRYIHKRLEDERFIYKRRARVLLSYGPQNSNICVILNFDNKCILQAIVHDHYIILRFNNRGIIEFVISSHINSIIKLIRLFFEHHHTKGEDMRSKFYDLLEQMKKSEKS